MVINNMPKTNSDYKFIATFFTEAVLRIGPWIYKLYQNVRVESFTAFRKLEVCLEYTQQEKVNLTYFEVYLESIDQSEKSTGECIIFHNVTYPSRAIYNLEYSRDGYNLQTSFQFDIDIIQPKGKEILLNK